MTTKASRVKLKKDVAAIVDTAISAAFELGLAKAAAQAPRGSTNHFIRMFGRTVRERVAGYETRGLKPEKERTKSRR